MAAPAHIARENGKKGGRPKGRKNEATLKKEAVLKAMQQRIMRSANRLLDVQMGLAKGSTYLFKVEKEVIIGPKGGKTYKSKRPELVTNFEEIRSYLEDMTEDGDVNDSTNPAATYYYITTKDPDRQAVKDMFESTFGRPTQAMELDVTSDGEKLQLFNEPQLKRIASRISNGGKSVKK